MLGLLLNSALDSIVVGLELTQILAKESLEFFLGNGDISLIFSLLLVLLREKQSNIYEEDSGKGEPILTLGSGGGKIVLTMLKEVTALQINFISIHV